MALTDISAPREQWSPRPDEVTPPSNDVVDYAEHLATFRGIEGRLGHAVRSKLVARLSRAGGAARMLAGEVGDAHSHVGREIVDAIDVTESMVHDLLEFWQAALGGGACVSRRRTNLRPLCERVLDSIQQRYPTHCLKLASDTRVEGEWDPEAVASLVARLVVNGVQHGPAHGAVRVRVRGLDDRAIIEVQSAGPLPADLPAHRLFEPFASARPRKSDGDTGLGLGLFLADRTARSHRGRIDVESSSHEGTTFRAALPRD